MNTVECKCSTALMRVDDANCLHKVSCTEHIDLISGHCLCFVRINKLEEIGCDSLDFVEIQSECGDLKCIKRIVSLPDEHCSRLFSRGQDMYFPSPHDMPLDHNDISQPFICKVRKVESSQVVNIEDIRLFRLFGRNYPAGDIEDAAIKAFFSSPRFVSNGQLLLVPYFRCPTLKSMYLPGEHLSSEAMMLAYYIHGVAGAAAAVPVTEHSGDHIDSAVLTCTSPNITRIVISRESESLYLPLAYSPSCQLFLLMNEMGLCRRRYLQGLQEGMRKETFPATKDNKSQLPIAARFKMDPAKGSCGVGLSVTVCPVSPCGTIVSARTYSSLSPLTGGRLPSTEITELNRHFSAVLSPIVPLAALCDCRVCNKKSLSRIMTSATLVQSQSQSETVSAIAQYTHDRGVMCLIRPFSTFEEFASGSISVDMFTGSAVGLEGETATGIPMSGLHEVNMLRTPGPYFLCIPGIHVDTTTDSSVSGSSAPRRLHGLERFLSHLMRALVKQDRGTCRSSRTSIYHAPCSGAGTPLVCLVGITDQQNLINLSVAMRDLFQHEIQISSLAAHSEVLERLTHLQFFAGLDDDEKCGAYIVEKLKQFSKGFGRRHLEQYVDEVRLQCSKFDLSSNSSVSLSLIRKGLNRENGTPSSSTLRNGLCDSGVSMVSKASGAAEISARVGGWLSESDCISPPSPAATATARISSTGQTLGVRWRDIGGLERVREQIMDTLLLPIKYPALFASDVDGSLQVPPPPRQTGILLFGPPGSGKTMVAKAVATECEMNFISIKGPELLDMYVGESEKHVRDLFERAKRDAPCVLFFDELDSLAPCRAKQGSGGGVMDRVVSQLLTEIDSVNSPDEISSNGRHDGISRCVFIIAATNRPDLLDPALLRPGRLDKKIYLGPCETDDSKLQVIAAQTKNFKLDADVTCQAICAMLAGKFVTGADIGAFTSRAYSLAMERCIASIEEKVSREVSVCGLNGVDAMEVSRSVACHDVRSQHVEISSYIQRIVDEEKKREEGCHDDANPPSELDVVVSLLDFQTAAMDLRPAASVLDMKLYRLQKEMYDS